MHTLFLALIPAYIFYIFLLGLYMFKVRYQAIMTGKVSPKYFQNYKGDIPDEVKVVGDHFNNQFQVPVLFMVTCLAVVVLRAVDVYTVVLGYSFFATRIAHTIVHFGSNNLRIRPPIYFLGFLLLIGMWISILFG